MALDPKTKKAQDDFVAARKSLPAKGPDAVKKEYATLTDEADIWVAQLKNYAAAVEKPPTTPNMIKSKRSWIRPRKR